MQLSKIRIRNYRLLIDAELEVDPKTTLIVGRNNTAKTSCFVCIGNVLEGENISFNDYPLLKREDFYTKIALFMEKKLSYEDLCKQVEVISIDFIVDAFYYRCRCRYDNRSDSCRVSTKNRRKNIVGTIGKQLL